MRPTKARGREGWNLSKVFVVYVSPLEMGSTEDKLVDLPTEQEALSALLLKMGQDRPLYVEVSDYSGSGPPVRSGLVPGAGSGAGGPDLRRDAPPAVHALSRRGHAHPHIGSASEKSSGQIPVA